MDENILNLIEQLSSRLSALETTVNDTIIGGWKKAEEEYKDNEAYEAFCSKYGSEIEPLKPNFTVLYGEDFDLPKEMYNQLKQTEGYGSDEFDEDGLVRDKILELTEKFANLNKDNSTDKPEEKDTEQDLEEKIDNESIPSMEELKKLYHESKGE